MKKSFMDIQGKILTSFIVVFYLIHPSITKGVFSFFNCVEIDGVLKVQEDTTQVCYGPSHLYYVQNASLPSIIMWILGLPLGALWLLFRNGKYLERLEKPTLSPKDVTKLQKIGKKYQFLYAGFHASHFYWEVLIMFRKIGMIAAGVFLSMSSSELQTLIMMSLMTMSLCLHLKHRPYHHDPMNTLETYSHLVALVTLYTGMLYVTSSSSPYLSTPSHPPSANPHWFFFTLLLLPNLLFLLSWLSHLRLCLLQTLH